MLAAFVDAETKNVSAKEELVDALADAFEAFVKSGEIPIGLVVSTPSGPGATTQPGKLI